MIGHRFRIPASTSNLGPGFDSIGLALTRHLQVSITPAQSFIIEARGVNATLIPTDMDNLVLRVAQNVASRRSRTLPPFRIDLENAIPIGCGLGSSAVAILAGITCYELITGDRLSDREIFQCAFTFEPHPDNLAPSLYGGLISAAVGPDGEALVARLNVAASVRPIIVNPEFELSTEKARKVLPQSYSRADTVYNIQRAAMTIAALTTGAWTLLRESMRDRIHQPYRTPLIPGLNEILDLKTPGLLGVALSGAGPAVFALATPGCEEQVGSEIARVFERHGVHAAAYPLDIDSKGRVIAES